MKSASRVFHKGLKVYYGQRRFLLASPSYWIDRSKHPYRRLSATLLIACRQPFTLDAGDEPPITTRAALVAPKVPRRRTLALDSDLLIFDMPLGSPEFAALVPLFAEAGVQALDIERFAPLFPVFQQAGEGKLSCPELNALFRSVVEALCGHPPQPPELDPRIEQVLAWMDEIALDQMDTASLAARVNLSPSRLRHLFSTQTGCSLSHYARWVGLWRAVEWWDQGKTMTEIAHEGGFHDLAHLNRAYAEILGMPPSSLVESDQVNLIRCPRG